MQRSSSGGSGLAGRLENLAQTETYTVLRTYDRMAPFYDLLDGLYERSWKSGLRRQLFAHAVGRRLLDVGVGTGCNMPFYPRGAEVTGIDASSGMLARARRRARRLGLKPDLRQMDLLRIEAPDGAFDTVAVTFVLLCLPDELQLPALRELARVTSPEGRILLLDYHRSSRTGMRLWTGFMSAWLRWAFAARFDPPTEHYVELAGLQVERRESFVSHGVIMLVLRRGQGDR